MTLSRSTTSKIISIRAASSRSHGQLSLRVGPEPWICMTLFYQQFRRSPLPIQPVAMQLVQPVDQVFMRCTNVAGQLF
jgi:hypothetical protein